jgi:hypothetical protein
MDFVHLDDMSVMFDDFSCAAASARFAEFKVSARGMSATAGGSKQRAPV